MIRLMSFYFCPTLIISREKTEISNEPSVLNTEWLPYHFCGTQPQAHLFLWRIYIFKTSYNKNIVYFKKKKPSISWALHFFFFFKLSREGVNTVFVFSFQTIISGFGKTWVVESESLPVSLYLFIFYICGHTASCQQLLLPSLMQVNTHLLQDFRARQLLEQDCFRLQKPLTLPSVVKRLISVFEWQKQALLADATLTVQVTPKKLCCSNVLLLPDWCVKIIYIYDSFTLVKIWTWGPD